MNLTIPINSSCHMNGVTLKLMQKEGCNFLQQRSSGSPIAIVDGVPDNQVDISGSLR